MILHCVQTKKTYLGHFKLSSLLAVQRLPRRKEFKKHANEMLHNKSPLPSESLHFSAVPNLYSNTFCFLLSHSNALSLFLLFHNGVVDVEGKSIKFK